MTLIIPLEEYEARVVALYLADALADLRDMSRGDAVFRLSVKDFVSAGDDAMAIAGFLGRVEDALLRTDLRRKAPRRAGA